MREMVLEGAFRQVGLSEHNELRRRHGVGALVLSAKLNAVAQRWADTMASENSLRHSTPADPRARLGENIHWARSFGGSEAAAKAAVDSFYDEISDYSFTAHGPRSAGRVVGHFTQVVWRRCYELGLGIALSRKGHVYICVNYDPPGNCEGSYADNVFPVGSVLAPAPPLSDVPGLVAARHNHFRGRHAAPSLLVNTFLNAQAQRMADDMAKHQSFHYVSSLKSQWRQNIAIVSEFSPTSGVDKWYEEGKAFGPGMGYSAALACFTQLVWRSTKRVGVGLGVGRPWSVLVCLYDPRTDISAFAANVIPTSTSISLNNDRKV